MEDKIALIVQVLKRIPRIEFQRLVKPFSDKLHGVITLLAGLELAKRRELTMRQGKPFSALWFYSRRETVSDATDADR
jgi:chromatin segregation and condensation protein Rec8/ScpA/Scc1 (kleisin family)